MARVIISRRAWLSAASVIGAAGAFEALSLGGAFDHRDAPRVSDNSMWRSAFMRIERLGDYVNGVCPIGHSTNLMVIKGTRVLTDPWFYDPADGLLCHDEGPAVLPEDMGPLHAIFISHNHGDHFDKSALDRLDKTAKVLTTTEGVAKSVRRLGYTDIVTLPAWASVTIGKAELVLVPSFHSPHSLGLVLRNDQGKDGIYFASDTAFSDSLREITDRLQPRLAILPVDGAKTRFFSRRVMNIEEAMAATRLLQVRRVVPSHDGARPCGWFAERMKFRVPDASAQFAKRVRLEMPGVLCLLPKPGDFVRV